jgi:hypothetical protein
VLVVRWEPLGTGQLWTTEAAGGPRPEDVPVHPAHKHVIEATIEIPTDHFLTVHNLRRSDCCRLATNR